MKNFFKDLFKYSHHVNVQLIDILNENKEKDIESIIRLMSHVLNVHRIWNAKVKTVPVLYGSWDIHAVDDMAQIEQENFGYSMQLLETYELTQPITYMTGSGKQFTNTVQEILFQAINHSTYHRGQVATAFRQAGIEPILTDYIFYKWQGN